MLEWDNELANSITQKHGKSTDGSLVYKIVGGKAGIALSNDDTGFARVELHISCKDRAPTTRVVLLGFMVAHFAPESSHLRSIVWTTLST
jgi:hypothetical protein